MYHIKVEIMSNPKKSEPKGRKQSIKRLQPPIYPERRLLPANEE